VRPPREFARARVAARVVTGTGGHSPPKTPLTAASGMMNRSSLTPPEPEAPIERQVELAFLPLHKRAFGTAAGLVSALLVFMVTLVHLARAADPQPLALLGQYFYGYTVSFEGALIGAFWAGFAGFAIGWFFAFCRNLTLAASAFLLRTRAELANARDFLDHI